MPAAKITMTISSVARAADVNIETIRYYQRRGLLQKPQKPVHGYRQYKQDAVNRVRFIKRAQDLGFTLNEIKTLLLLGDGHCRETHDLAKHKLALIQGRIHDLEAMGAVLNKLVRACEKHGDSPGCPIIESLSGSRTLDSVPGYGA